MSRTRDNSAYGVGIQAAPVFSPTRRWRDNSEREEMDMPEVQDGVGRMDAQGQRLDRPLVCGECGEDITGGYVLNEVRTALLHYRCWWKEQLDENYEAGW